jgi:hypothetical protein
MASKESAIGENPGAEGYIFAADLLAGAGAVVAVVVVLDDFHDPGIDERRHDAGADAAMREDIVVLRGREHAGLVLDAGIDADLADIVEEGRPAQVFQLFAAQSQGAADATASLVTRRE